MAIDLQRSDSGPVGAPIFPSKMATVVLILGLTLILVIFFITGVLAGSSLSDP